MRGEEGFDEVIHAPIRLRICGLLNRVESLSFATLRDALQISDAHLSKQLRILADADYVRSTRTPSRERSDGRRVAWVSLTVKGRSAFAEHVAALHALVDPDVTPLSGGLDAAPPTGPAAP